MLYKTVLIFESVDEILKCDHSAESRIDHSRVILVVLFIHLSRCTIDVLLGEELIYCGNLKCFVHRASRTETVGGALYQTIRRLV